MASFDKFGFERNKNKADMSDLESRIARLEQNGMSVKNIFPVGYIFLTFNSNFNPNNTFTGTTWKLVDKGRMLVNHNPGDNAFNQTKKTGGSKSHSHTIGATAITEAQMPHHAHVIGPHEHSFFFNQNSQNGLTDAQWNGGNNTEGFKADRSIFVEYHEDYDPSHYAYWRATWRLADGNEFGKLNIRRIGSGSSQLRTGGVLSDKPTYGTGGGQAHDHTCSSTDTLPPYIVCYMWERIS